MLLKLQRVSEQQATKAVVLIEGKTEYLIPEEEEWSIIDDLIKIKFWSHSKRLLKLCPKKSFLPLAV